MKPPKDKENQIEDLTSEVIQCLSKEIETTTNNATVFRSRISFAVFFGPFIILGSFVVAAKGLPIVLNRDKWDRLSYYLCLLLRVGVSSGKN